MHNSSATTSRLFLPDKRSVWEAVETEDILTIAFNIVRDGDVRMTEVLHRRSLEYHLNLLGSMGSFCADLPSQTGRDGRKLHCRSEVDRQAVYTVTGGLQFSLTG